MRAFRLPFGNFDPQRPGEAICASLCRALGLLALPAEQQDSSPRLQGELDSFNAAQNILGKDKWWKRLTRRYPSLIHPLFLGRRLVYCKRRKL